jgi:CO/xanthine dehydrogenase Mo-binding subunit
MTWACPLEPFTAIADYTDEGLLVYSCAQHLYMVRRDLADIFGLPLNRVHLVTPFIGGGYGAKSYTKIEPLAAIASWKVGRPVRLELTMDESVLTSRGPDATLHVRTAVDANGRLLARQATIYMNTGAYAENSPLVSSKTAMRLLGAYLWDAVDVTSYAVYTNTCPSSSHRGFGTLQSSLASESQIEDLAERLGLDPVAFRLLNLPDAGQRFYPKRRGLTADLKGDLQMMADRVFSAASREPRRGRGLAVGVLDAGAQPIGRSEVRFHGDGSITVLTGSAELGQGSGTVLAQIAAEEFGTDLDRVRVVQSDTLRTPFARSTGAGRTTSLEGLTVLMACRDAKEQLRIMAAEAWEAREEDVVLEASGVSIDGVPVGWSAIIARYFGIADMEVSGRAHIRQADILAEMPPWWELALAAVEVDVDRDTGALKLTKLVTVADTGLSINPALIEGQDLGAAVMGLGVALGEELIYDGEQLANATMLDYRVPRFSDVPRDVETIVVENQDGVGPYGAKGHGDGAAGVVHAAVASALHNAFGVRLADAAMTPERVWRALSDAGRAEAPTAPDGGREK